MLRSAALSKAFLSTLSVWRATRIRVSKVKIEKNFYPRSPYGERLNITYYRTKTELFLSTLSVWRATTPVYAAEDGTVISIHALRMESDESLRYIVIKS